jgi:outer membrane protein W
MKTMRALLAVALLLGLAGEAQAQGDWFWGGAYSMGLPLSKTKDFNSSFSYRGVTVEGRKIVNENVSVGLSFGWNVFDRGLDTTTTFESGLAIGGYQIRYTNAFPLFANAHYYLGERNALRPFIGANVGTLYVERRVDINLYSVAEDAWQFAFAPEVGVAFPLGWIVRGFVSARWQVSLEGGGVPAQQYVSFNVGIASR